MIGPAEIEASLALKRSDWRAIQAALAGQGYPVGAIDGLFGRKSRDALASWQRSRDLPVTGHVDADQHEILIELERERVEAARLASLEAAKAAADASAAAAASAAKTAKEAKPEKQPEVRQAAVNRAIVADIGSLAGRLVDRRKDIVVNDGYCDFPTAVQRWREVADDGQLLALKSGGPFKADGVKAYVARDDGIDTKMLAVSGESGIGVAAYVVVRNPSRFFKNSFSYDKNHLCERQIIDWRGWAYLFERDGNRAGDGKEAIAEGLFGFGGVALEYDRIQLASGDYRNCVHFKGIRTPVTSSTGSSAVMAIRSKRACATSFWALSTPKGSSTRSVHAKA
ncbi:MAG: peptidoglycan-binding domain-containing protein [Geminicoccaceae bacterium]